MRRTQTFVPVSLLSVYTNGSEYYIEQSKIVEKGGWYDGWKPLDEAFIEHVFKHFKTNGNKVMFGGYIPTNVIGYGDKLSYNLVMWRTEPQKVQLFFDAKLKIPDGKYHVPGLVWTFGSHLDLYAYTQWDAEKTQLYYAPFHNINQGSVCLGTAADYLEKEKTEYTFRDITNKVETAFWKSRFTHGTDDKQINGSFQGMYTRSQIEFPVDVLIPAHKTVKQLCNEVFST